MDTPFPSIQEPRTRTKVTLAMHFACARALCRVCADRKDIRGGFLISSLPISQPRTSLVIHAPAVDSFGTKETRGRDFSSLRETKIEQNSLNRNHSYPGHLLKFNEDVVQPTVVFRSAKTALLYVQAIPKSN